MGDLDHREAFANRLRSLRSTAGLSIEEASGRGGLSPNFWGNVERNEKEPCLDIICSLAKGLGITPDVLMKPEDIAAALQTTLSMAESIRSTRDKALFICWIHAIDRFMRP